jgi:hypothetical protein
VAVLMFYTNPDYVKFFFLDDRQHHAGLRGGLQIHRLSDHEEDHEHRGLAP